MKEKKFFNISLGFIGIVTLAIWALLAWNHYHGGVPSHHILAKKELPEISNWWGGLLLPLLTAFLLYRIQKRVFGNPDASTRFALLLQRALYGFVGSLLFGILLSTFFSLGHSDLCGYMVLSLFPLALFFPIYRAECLLGFVLGMTYTFGAMLPTAFGSILVLISIVLYVYIRYGLLYIGAILPLPATFRPKNTNY